MYLSPSTPAVCSPCLGVNQQESGFGENTEVDPKECHLEAGKPTTSSTTSFRRGQIVTATVFMLDK